MTRRRSTASAEKAARKRRGSGHSRALQQACAARARLASESKKAQESTAKAVRALLKGMHLSVRDAGDLIGIPPQRVHQRAHENR